MWQQRSEVVIRQKLSNLKLFRHFLALYISAMQNDILNKVVKRQVGTFNLLQAIISPSSNLNGHAVQI